VALARRRRHHRQQQNEILFAVALARLRHQHGGHLRQLLRPDPPPERPHEPAPGAPFEEADPEVEGDGLGAARSSDPSPRSHVTIGTPTGDTLRYSDAFSWQQVRAAFRGILWALARRHRAHRSVVQPPPPPAASADRMLFPLCGAIKQQASNKNNQVLSSIDKFH
jgi:hypothetical protein